MLKLRFSKIYRIIAVLMLAFWLFPANLPSLAATSGGPDQAVIDSLNAQLKAQQDKIDAIVDKIDQYKASINNVRGEAATLKNQVAILENQIAKSELDIQAKEEEAKKTELEMQKVLLQIRDNEGQMDKNKADLAELVRLINRYDGKNYLSVMLSYDSFSEFFDQVKYSEDIQKNLQQRLDRVQELNAQLESQRQDLETKKKQLEQLLEKMENSRDVLDGQKQAKNVMITQSKQSEKKFQGIVEDLKKEQAAANSQIAAIERQIRAELAKRSDNKLETVSNEGMIWPTVSRRITSTFHDPDYPYRYLFEHSGLDIGVGRGTSVMAAESGYIAKVALGTKWYGNYVMIVHNGNMSTLYAHLDSVNVKADQFVNQGQVIGKSGNTGFSSGPHLHFEVRSNGVPVNPLNYLSN